MKRKVLLCLAAYISGIVAADKIKDMPPLVFIFAAAVIAVIVRYFCFGNKNRIRGAALASCIFFVFGIIRADIMLSEGTGRFGLFSGEEVNITARVIEVSDTDGEYYDKYRVSVYSAETADGEKHAEGLNRKFILSLKKYGQKNKVSAYRYGDVITAKVYVSEPERPMNRGETDYSYVNKADGIFYTLTGEYDGCEYLRSEVNYANIYDSAHAVREYCEKVIDKHFSGDCASLLKGILLSEKTFGEEYRTKLSESGMTHITVASGLHTGCVFAAVLWLCFAMRMKKLHAYMVCAVSLWAFAFLQGLTPSILRAVIMLCFYMIAQLIGRSYDKENILYITAFIMLFVNPYMIYDAAFILSFGSVFGIVLFAEGINSYVVRVLKFKKLSSIVSVTLAVQIAIFPLLALFFNKVSVYSIAANVLIVPVLTVVIVLGFALIAANDAAAFIASAIAFVLRVVAKYINMVIYAVSALPFSSVDIFSMNLTGVCIYYLLIFALRMYINAEKYEDIYENGNWKWGGRNFGRVMIALCVILAVCMTAASAYTDSFMNVTFINVGQGDAALIQIPGGKTAVIDGGGSSPVSKSDVGERIFVPYLRRNGINKVDYVFLSHYDKDHAQGIAALLNDMEVENLVVPYRKNDEESEYKKKINALAVDKGINVMYFKEGDKVSVGGAVFEAVAPTLKNAANRAMSENQKSMMLKLTYGKTGFLFAGDVEVGEESRAAKLGEKIRADVLKVAHHGSSTSSGAKFIRTVAPEYAVISVGKDNRYNLPSRETLNTLAREGVDVYRTDECGTISFRVGRDGIKRIDTLYKRQYEKQTAAKARR